MTRLEIGTGFVRRYAFAAILFASLAVWFGYDGAVRYPRTDAAELYRAIERTEPPAGADLAVFKRQKTQTQLGLALLFAVASAWVGLVLAKAARFRFAYDETGFAANGREYVYADILSVDRRRWEKKGILVLRTKAGEIALDACHHRGVEAFERQLANRIARGAGEGNLK